jgi:hypothetical protein
MVEDIQPPKSSSCFSYITDVPKLWGASSGGTVGPMGGTSCLYEESIYFGRHGAGLKYESCFILELKYH